MKASKILTIFQALKSKRTPKVEIIAIKIVLGKEMKEGDEYWCNEMWYKVCDSNMRHLTEGGIASNNKFLVKC